MTATFTEADLLRALRECFFPALRRDVVSAGLVRSAKLEMDGEAPGTGIAGVPPRFIARVALWEVGLDEALNTQLNAQLRAAVENRLLGLPSISRVETTMSPALFPILSNMRDRSHGG